MCLKFLKFQLFIANVFHIVHMMMIKDRHFSLCRQLFDTIGYAKDKRKTFFLLPILVTLICKK